MTFRRVLKRALPLWAAFVFLAAFMLEVSDVVHKEGWSVALERFALVVVVAYPMSVAIIYRISSGANWYRKL